MSVPSHLQRLWAWIKSSFGNPPEPEKTARDIFFEESSKAALQSSNLIRKSLTINEDAFRHFAPYLCADPREPFIYRVLDEIKKTSITLMRLHSYLNCNGSFDPKTEEERLIARVTMQSSNEEIALRCRKLREAMLDVILFQSSNRPEVYREYFLLLEINDIDQQQRDRGEFYGIRSTNQDLLAKHLLGMYEENKAVVSNADRWYLSTPDKPIQTEQGKLDVRLSSSRFKYIKVVRSQLSKLESLLTKSYTGLMHADSKQIHFTPHDTSSDFDLSDESDLNVMILLMINLVIEVEQLLPNRVELNHHIIRASKEKHEEANIRRLLTEKTLDVGDYAVARGDILCRILEVRESGYGFITYKVKFLSEIPMRGNEQDWFSSFEIAKAAKKSELFSGAEQVLRSHGFKGGEVDFDQVPIESLDAMAVEVHRMFGRGRG